MITIKQGDTIRISDSKSGDSAKGPYFTFKVKAERGNDSIALWSNDGEKFRDGDDVEIVEICEVRKSKRQYKEKWYDNFDVTAKLKVKSTTSLPIGYFAELTEDENKLPF
jgi:hypothetical protein